MNQFVLAMEIMGTVAFSLSGSMTGMKRRMDLFGVIVLGLVTAVGGGIIRDLVLGITPPATFRNPVYAAVSVAVSVVAFLPVTRGWLAQTHALYEKIMLVMDSVGLGIFTVVGIRIAHDVMQQENLFFLIFVGVITGVGGGVLRDVLAGNTPYIFVKHVYACASILGALVCALLWRRMGDAVAMLSGCAVVVVIRLLSAKYRWNLPRAGG